VTHCQCGARPTVTFPAAQHHRPLAGTELYCLAAKEHDIVCEQLVMKVEGLEYKSRPLYDDDDDDDDDDE